MSAERLTAYSDYLEKKLQQYDPHAADNLPIVMAVLHGKVKELRDRIDSGVSPNLTVVVGQGMGGHLSLLALAIGSGQRTIVDELLERGATVHSDGENAPLDIAAASGEDDFVKRLLDHGADIEQTGWDGHTALEDAVRLGHFSTVKLLLESGADMSKVLAPGGTVPAYIAESSDPERKAVEQLLIAHGAIPWREGVNTAQTGDRSVDPD